MIVPNCPNASRAISGNDLIGFLSRTGGFFALSSNKLVGRGSPLSSRPSKIDVRYAEYWHQAIKLAPNNYIEAQNWLKTTKRILPDTVLSS